MKSAVAHLLFCFIAFQSHSQGIKFQEMEWSAALEKARVENKLIFIDGMAQWSQPCKIMEAYAYKDPEAGEFFNEQFINLRYDMEDFPGVELAERYQVFLYPTMLFIDDSGRVVHRGCGAMDAVDLIDLGKEALDADRNLINMQKSYDEGSREPAFLAKMSLMLEKACLDGEAWVGHFFDELDQNEWTSEAAWVMINLNIQDPYSPYFQYLMKNRDPYALKYGRDTVDQKIYAVLLNQYKQIYEGVDLTLFAIQALKSMMAPLDFGRKGELEAMVNLKYAEEVENWQLYCRSAVQVVREQQISDPDQLNEFAWKIYVFSDEVEILNTAKDWVEPIARKFEDPTYMDTYASLLYKLGDVKEAIKWEKRAIRSAELLEEDLMHYQLQLERFQSE